MINFNKTSSSDKTNLIDNQSSRKYIIFYVLIFLFLVGMIYGTVLAKSDDSSSLNGYFSSYSTKSALSNLAVNFVYLVVAYFFGYCAIGQGIALLIPLVKGLEIGLIVANIYITSGVKGIAFCLVMIAPQTAISLIAIVISCRESFQFSNMFFKCIYSKSGVCPMNKALKLYNIKFVVLLSIIMISFVVDLIFKAIFGKVFL